MISTTDVVIRTGDEPGIRFRSGLTIFDEALVDGRLIGRYWSATGSIVPEGHLQTERALHLLRPVDSFRLRHAGIVENTIWRQVEAIWGMFARLRQRFPNVVFENCAGGGGRLDLGMLRYFQITEISDWMRAPRSLKIFNNVTLSLPPEICLRTFGTEVTDHYLYGDLDYQIRSACSASQSYGASRRAWRRLASRADRDCAMPSISIRKEFVRSYWTRRCSTTPRPCRYSSRAPGACWSTPRPTRRAPWPASSG